MVWSLIFAYLIYIGHQVALYVMLGIVQKQNYKADEIVVILTQGAFWLSEMILFAICVILYN